MKKIISIVTLSLIFMCGVWLAGCDGSGGSLNLSFSHEKIEMVLEQEPAQYEITVSNFGGDVNFDFSFESNIAKIVKDSIKNMGEGRYQFSIAPIASGSTRLTITLRGTSKVLDVPVVVSEALESFSLTNDLFVIKGESLTLNSSYFSFVPENTTLKNLTFSLKDGQTLDSEIVWDQNSNTIMVGEITSVSEIVMIATSEKENLLPYEFIIKVVSDIDLSAVSIVSYDQKEDSKDEFNLLAGTSVFPYKNGDGNVTENEKEAVNNEITLITNKDTMFQKQIEFTNLPIGCYVDVFASSGIIGDIAEGAPLVNKTGNFSFKIQSNNVSPKDHPYGLTFRVYQADFISNYKEIVIDVYSINKPNDIRINNNKQLDVVELYHNNATNTDFRFSVYPDLTGAQNEDDYSYTIGVYSSVDAVNVNGLVTLAKLSQYMQVSYGGLKLENLVAEGETQALITNMEDISSILSIKPNFYYDDYFIIKVSCHDKLSGIEICSNQFAIKIYQGTDKFGLIVDPSKDIDYTKGIYLSVSNLEYTFSGFEYDSNSTIGTLIVTPKDPSNIICQIEDVSGYITVDDGQKWQCKLLIKPTKVGEAEFIIQTQNGRYVTLKVIIIREISENDFAIQIDDNNQNSISYFKYKDVTTTYKLNTLETITLKGKNSNLYIKDYIDKYNDVNNYSYNYSLYIDKADTKYFEVVDNKHIVSKEFINDRKITIFVVFECYKAELFKHVKQDGLEMNFNFTLSCVDYFQSMNITVSDGNEGSQKTKSMSVYDRKDLSYNNKNLADAYIYLDLKQSESSLDYTNKITIASWSISALSQVKEGYNDPIGYFYSTKYEISGVNAGKPIDNVNYIGKFVYDYNGTKTISSFALTLCLKDDTGIEFESTVTIVLDDYIDVENIYLTAPADKIYLDATSSFNTYSLSAYVLPSNAMCQEISVYIDSATPSCISFEQNDKTITFTYHSGGSGTIRIFPVSVMKTNSIRDDYGNYYYHIALDFIAADGLAPETALKLSSYADLINIKLDLHYFVDTTINCNGASLYIPSFSGSIRGTFAVVPENTSSDTVKELFNNSIQSGAIVNFTVKNSGRNSGLFGILTSSARLNNLIISGKFDTQEWKIEQDSNVGILCGTNGGSIKNVQVSLYDQTAFTITNLAKIDSGTNVHLGMVAGVNTGTIEVNNNAKISTFMTKMTTSLNVEFKNNVSEPAYVINSYVGGVVGRNDGVITNNFVNGAIIVEDFGTNTQVNIIANSKFLSGVVGLNNGTIENIKAVGKLDNTNSNTYTAGLIGILLADVKVKGNISRVFITSRGTIAGLIANFNELVKSAYNITNNKVQAIDDARIGIEASLLVKYYDGDVFELAPSGVVLDTSNIAETYVTRDLTTNVMDEMPLDYYYGDIVIIDGKYNGKKFNTQGKDNVISLNIDAFALAVYKQAVSEENQQNIINNINVQDVLSIAEVNASEIKINSSQTNIAFVTNNGLNLSVGGTGLTKLTLTSSLNYLNSVEIDLYITKYFDHYSLYADRAHLNSLSSLKSFTVVNDNVKNIYFSCESASYIYKNTPIKLEANKEVSFNITYDTSLLEAGVVGQNMWIKAVNSQNGLTTIYAEPTISVENNLMLYAEFNNSLNAFIFVPEHEIEDPAEESSSKAQSQISVKLVTGIENIVIERSNIFAEPSNDVVINLEYDSFNTADILVPSIVINGKKLDYNEADGVFKNEMGNAVFKIMQTDKSSSDDIHYFETYLFEMIISEANYNAYKNAKVELTFSSKETEINEKIYVQYSPETISSILINNYSYEENADMIDNDDDVYAFVYKKDKMQSSSASSSIGKYNILDTFVYTQLSEFDYLEVTMNTSVSGGYLAIGKDGTINRNIHYISTNGTLTLRANKLDIVNNNALYDDNTGRMLEIFIIYSLPEAISEGTKVTISLTFFKNGDVPEVCGQKDITVVAKQSNRVEFSIYNKQSEDRTPEENLLDVDRAYKVVKGKKYVLETNIIGYSPEEVVFESSNSNVANIVNEGGVYYLNINNTFINYDGLEYYTVFISSYGIMSKNNNIVKGQVQKTALRVYEFLAQDELFDVDKISLRALSTVNITDVLVNIMQLEYVNYNGYVKDFENEFKQKATFKVLDGSEEIKFTETLYRETDDYKINRFEFQPKVVSEVAPYKISVTYQYTYKEGVPTLTILDGDRVIFGSKTFDVETYLGSNKDLPTPIYSYKDLLNIKENEHYRLVNDIDVDSSVFEPITVSPKVLDGNGYSIILKGDSYVSDIKNFALFDTIKENCTLKNINVVIKNRRNIQIDNNYSTQGANIGILVAVNNGNITNCTVKCEAEISVNLLATVSIMETSYFGSICALNNGYVTHCRVEANISVGGASVGGVVAKNEGEIASSYIRKSRIANTTGRSNENISTGGFVCTNNGKISMCYIEGNQSGTKIYSDFSANEYGLSSKIIYSSSAVGGFVYQNEGEIFDCYANIPIISSSRCSGFVGINNGSIERAISLCKLKQRDTLNYGFVISYDTQEALFLDCYFIIEKGIINDFTSETNYDNITYKGVIKGIEPLSITEFNICEKVKTSTAEGGTKVEYRIKENHPFKNFIVGADKNDVSGVWFYTNDSTKESLIVSEKQSYLSEVADLKYYDLNNKEYVNQSFIAGALQLSSPNIIASSRYEINTSSSAEYSYSVDDTNVYYGSKNNPYLISNAQELEEHASQIYNSGLEYYRLICNIDYEKDKIFSTDLTDNTLFANFEGNNFAISNYTINSKTAYVSAGLFAQIGKQNSMFSCVKNVTFEPSYINLPNSVYVGGIAGTIAQANVYNVTLNGQNIVITGKNIVGGMFGRSTGENRIIGIKANIVAKSSQYGSQLISNKYDMKNGPAKILFNETGINRATVSYGGGLIGFVGGTTSVQKAHIGAQSKAFGVVAGLLFGGVGSNSTVSKINVLLDSYDNEIKSYAYGGIISGENRGKISNITIDEESNILSKKLFSCYPIVPVSIGGVAGIMTGGEISNISSTKGYSIIGTDFTTNYSENIDQKAVNIVNNPYVVKHVGGVVGYVVKGTIKQISIYGLEKLSGNETDELDKFDIKDGVATETENGEYKVNKNSGLIVSGGNYVGGIVGYAENITIQDIRVQLVGHKKYVNQDGNELDELIYSSYVSQASLHLIADLEFEENIYFAFIIGYCESTLICNGDVINKNDEYKDNSNCEVIYNDIYLYYADYYCTSSKPNQCYDIGGKGFGTKQTVNVKTVNIATGTIY